MSEAVRVLYVYNNSVPTHPNSRDLVQANEEIIITTAQTVDQAINSIESKTFDCILSTHELLDGDGITFLRRLRNHNITLPFILYVSNGSEKLASEAISAGVTEYIQATPKTNQIENISNQIIRVTRQHSNEYDYPVDEITEVTDDVLWLVSSDWKQLLHVNSAYASIWGQEETTLQDDPLAFLEAVHPDDRPTAEAAMQRLTAGESATVELRVNTKEDYRRRVFVQAEPMHGPDGTVQRIAGVSRDVTQQRAQQRQLKQEQQMMESIFSALPDVLYTFDTAGYLLRWNNQLEDETGYSADEIANMHVTDFVPDDEVENIFDSFQAVVADHETVTVESAFETNSGQRIPFEFTGGPIEDDNGDLQGVTGIGRNISERKQQRRRYKAVFNNTFQFTGLMSPDGTLLEVNQTAIDFADISRDELVGEKIWDAFWFQATETAQQIARKSVKTAREGEFFRDQITVQGANRDIIIDFSVRPVTDESGEINLLVPEGRDITRLSEREQQLEVTSRFLRHNLRNKLGIIEGYGELLAKHADDELQSHGATIVNSASELSRTSELARKIHNLIERNPEQEPINVEKQIIKAVSIAKNGNSQTDISTNLSSVPEASCIATIHEAFAALLTRVIKANGSGQQAIAIDLVKRDSSVIVAFELDKRISPIEREVLTGDIDIEQTRHAEGLAIWYVYWQVWYSGGEIEVLKDNRRVEIRFPICD